MLVEWISGRFIVNVSFNHMAFTEDGRLRNARAKPCLRFSWPMCIWYMYSVCRFHGHGHQNTLNVIDGCTLAHSLNLLCLCSSVDFSQWSFWHLFRIQIQSMILCGGRIHRLVNCFQFIAKTDYKDTHTLTHMSTMMMWSLRPTATHTHITHLSEWNGIWQYWKSVARYRNDSISRQATAASYRLIRSYLSIKFALMRVMNRMNGSSCSN